MYVWIYSSLIVLYIAKRLFPADFLSYAVGILAAITLLISSRKASGLYFFTGLFFLISGFFLFFYNGTPLYTFLFHFESMLALLSLFFLLPYINSLIQVGRFDKQFNQLLKLNTHRLSQLYKRSSLVTFMLGVFLNIATIPLLVRTLSFSLSSFSNRLNQRFYSQSLLRAYALCLTWSPLEVLVSVAIDSTNVEYYKIFPVLFLLSMLCMLLDWRLFSSGTIGALPIQTPNLTPGQLKRLKKKIWQLVKILLAFITTVSLVDYVSGYGYLFSVILTMVPFSVLTAWTMRKRRQYFSISIPHWKERTEHLSNYFFMFLSAGFFVEMLSETEWVYLFQSYLSQRMEHVFPIYLLTGAYFLVTSLTGFHPLVSITLFIQLIEPMMDRLSSLSFTLVLITSSIMTVMYSPYNLSVSLLSNEIKVNPYRITLWNIGFALFYLLLSIGVAYGIHIVERWYIS